MAKAAARLSDGDLAFEMQLNEAIAASLGIEGAVASLSELEAFFAAEQMEVERSQLQLLDRTLAAEEQQRAGKQLSQVHFDAKVAREIQDMSESEWEESGDLFERPICNQALYRVFFKGIPVKDATGGGGAGIVIGGVVFDTNGMPVSEVKRYMEKASGGKVIAQYLALAEVLQSAYQVGARTIIVYTDVVAIYKQLKNVWRVKSRAAQTAYTNARHYLDRFNEYDINLAVHGENWPAQEMARQAWVSVKESASPAMEHCVICFDDKRVEEMFTVPSCGHKFCLSCTKLHAEAKLEADQLPVCCPQVNCQSRFTEAECKLLLSEKSFQQFLRWLAESRVPEPFKVYCPYPRCSYMMDRRTFTNRSSDKVCTACRKRFCMDCRVPWHYSYTCEGYQRLPPEQRVAEDANLYRLAQNQKWRQCMLCRRMIELSEGCYHMTCRCGYEFCYTCGAPWRNGIQTCSCPLWDEHWIIRQEDSDSDEDDE